MALDMDFYAFAVLPLVSSVVLHNVCITSWLCNYMRGGGTIG